MGDQRQYLPQKENSEAAPAEKSATGAKTPAQRGFPHPPRVSGKLGGSTPDDIPLTPENILFLQRTIGNQATVRFVQRRLKIGQPNDPYEREADHVAEQVMRMPEPSPSQPASFSIPTNGMQIQRADSTHEVELRRQSLDEEKKRKRLEEEGTVSAKESPGETPALSPKAESQINNLQSGGGEPLSESARAYFEPRFGQDFSGVRVHHGSQAAESAQAINARAYTTGQDVVFGAGEYTPETGEGKRLLAHELTHVVQQGATMNSGPMIQKQDIGMTVSQQRSDAPYGWTSAYGLEVNASEVRITVHARIVPDAGVSAADVARTQEETRREFQRYFDRRFNFVDDSGNSRELVVDIEFVASGEELTISLHAGAGHDNRTQWYVDSDPIDRAHELGHQIGLLDEYVDPRTTSRATAASSGVYTDNSIMGNYYTEGRRDADVRARHGGQLAADISSATGINFTSEWSDTYTVRQGDNLSWIARRIYGDASRWRDIYNLNRAQIRDPDLIYPGQVLKLPPR